MYINAAASQDSIFFGLVTSKEIAAAMQAKFDSIILYKKFDEEQAVFNGQWNIEDIVTFIIGEQLPLVTKFTDDVRCTKNFCVLWNYFLLCFPHQTAPKIFGGKIKTHLLAFFPGDDKTILESLREVASNFRGKVSPIKMLTVGRLGKDCSIDKDILFFVLYCIYASCH